MKEVIIIGSGGHGAELDDYIHYNNNIQGFEDDMGSTITIGGSV